MGTSTSFGGPANCSPLVPSWLEEDGSAGPEDKAPVPEPSEDRRLTNARRNVTRDIGSGVSDRRSLGRTLSGYVSKSGRKRKVTQRMGASRTSSVKLLNVLISFVSQGVQESLRELNISE